MRSLFIQVSPRALLMLAVSNAWIPRGTLKAVSTDTWRWTVYSDHHTDILIVNEQVVDVSTPSALAFKPWDKIAPAS